MHASRTAGQPGLIASKLHVPRTGPGFIPRRRLLDQFEYGLARGLVLVCAPPGFGKTALLADCVGTIERPVAWLSLDAGDKDPARFWRHLIAALDRVRPGIAAAVTPLIEPPIQPSFNGLVEELINHLSARSHEGDALLILDDYHLVEPSPVQVSLTFFIEHLPAGVNLVIATRADPALPLARLRARGQLQEIRDRDLRFTREEAASLLREAVGYQVRLSDSAVETLACRTEGWAAGLQLAALSLKGAQDADDFVATFGGSHRYVVDYLAEEVLERQPESVRTFLLETSILDRLSGALCDAVTGRTDGQQMLEAIERANLFLFPLDEVRGWWRYHHLFADLLRVRLQREDPKRVSVLHRSASAWCRGHGLVDEAVQHALNAGDQASAASLVEQHVDEFFTSGEGATIQRWLSALPAELVASRPRLCLAHTWIALNGGQLEGILPRLDIAEKAAVDARDEAFEPSVGRPASLLSNISASIGLHRAYLASLSGDADATAKFARNALADIAPGEWMLDCWIHWHVGLAHALRGELSDAERELASSIDGWLRGGWPNLAVRGCHHLGQVQRAKGDLDGAIRTYQRALEVAAVAGVPALPSAGAAYVGLADVAYERDELDNALSYMTEAISRCRQLAYTQPLATGLATLARIRQANGDASGALAAIDEAERAGPGPHVNSLFNPVPALHARLLLQQGQIAAADRWTRARGLHSSDEPDYQRERDYLVRARVLLAYDQPEQAAVLLRSFLNRAVAEGRVGSVIEIQALHALALAAMGDDGALRSLTDALAAAQSHGYIRVFADEGAPMAALLRNLSAAQSAGRDVAPGVPVAYVRRILQATRADASPIESPSPAALRATTSDPLTERELEVLRLLATGKENRDIADELSVTVDTVKKHITHIFAKLGVGNRTEASARGRDLGLITS